MNPTAIYSKSGKGVQEASGKTSLLARADRAVLAAFDGRATVGEVAQKCGKTLDAAFEQIVNKLDRDGFIREVVTAGASAPVPPPRQPGKPAAPKPAAPSEPGEDLDFSALSVPVSKPARPSAPPPPPDARAAAEAERHVQEQASTLAKARQDAEARAQKERDRMKAETEAKLRAEMEAKMRAEAAAKGQADLEAKMRAESEAKVKAARDAAVRAAAEAKAKAEAEMKARLEEERKKAEAERKAREETERMRKEAEEKARREAEELKKRLEEERARAEAERKAREEVERKAREEADRVRKEAEEKARAEAEALRKQLEEERRKLEEERKARAEEDERRKRAEEENERKRRAKEEDERQRRAEEQDRQRRAAEEAEAKRVAQEKASAAAAETNPRGVVVPPASAAPAESFDDNLLADLESFDKRDEGEQKAKEEAERQARAAADRKAREQRELDDERRTRAEEADRKARQAAEQAQREEARRAREEEDRKDEERRAKELLAGAVRGAQAPAEQDDIGVSDDDLDMDDVKHDERALSATAKRQAREREAAKAEAAAPVSRRRPVKWGKLVGTTIAVAVIGGLAWLHLMPLPVGDYEKAASTALGRPVKIGSARFSLLTGPQIRFQNVLIGSDVKLASVRAAPQASALFGGRKAFNRIDVEGVTMPENALGEVLFGKHKSETFTVRRLVAHDLRLGAPLVLPPLEADFTFADDGGLQTAVLNGPEGLLTHLTPKGSEVEFDMTAARFALPMAPDVSLSQFAMKGTASARGMKIESWDGALFDGRFAGAADLRWGANWEVQGPITVRGVNAAVFAPALLSEGKADGSGRYAMSGSHPEKLMDAAHVEGNFTITKGTLGNIDLSRAIQTGGRQSSGRTQFNELNGQGVYEKGAVALRNLTITAGALNAGASVDVAQTGALSGRIVADVKTASQNLRATLNLGGTVKEPQVRN